MTEPTLSLQFDDFAAAVGRFLQWTDNEDNWSGSNWSTVETQKKEIFDIIQSGYRRFLYPLEADGVTAYAWSFLRPKYSFSLKGAYSTGTVSVSSTTVTASVGTEFPDYTATGKMYLIVDGDWLPVASITSDTELELDSATTFDADSSYSLVIREYYLPDDFGFMDSDLVYDPDVTDLVLTNVPAARINQLRANMDIDGHPTRYAIQPRTATAGSTGQRYDMLVYPNPDADYTVTGYYKISNPTQLTTSSGYPLGGSECSECIKECILAAAEKTMHDEIGLHESEAQRLLRIMISNDKMKTAATSGHISPGTDGPSFKRSDVRLFYGDTEL